MKDTDFPGGGITFDLPKNRSASIKVMGVGGGGTNAVNYMFNQGIHGVDFVVCNTDAQALDNSPVPSKVQLGISLTEGLGAGANPEIGKKAAVESADAVKSALSTNTKMLFITAGMGGGTGTGAAPVIASIARDLDILTVGIVTAPFYFEGKKRLEQAKSGIEEMRKHVDSLIVINNEKLRELYGDLGFKEGFSKADRVLTTAAKGIADVITHHFTQNIDLHDVKTVLANSGTAIMGSATAAGANRAKEGIVKALDSPLLNNNKITGSQNVLLLIVSGTKEITMDEIASINEYIQNEAGNNANIIMGIGEDDDLEEGVSITIVATGFSTSQQEFIADKEAKKVYHALDDEQPITKTMVTRPGELARDDAPRENEPASSEIYDVEPLDLKPSLQEKMRSDTVLNQPLVQGEEGDDSDRGTPDQQTFLFDEPPLDGSAAGRSAPVKDTAVPETQTESIRRHQLKPGGEDELKFEVRDATGETIPESDKSSAPEAGAALENPFDTPISEAMTRKALARRQRLRAYNYRFEHTPKSTEYGDQPAYKRKGIDLADDGTSLSRFTLDVGEDNEIRLRDNNSFLHDNVD